MRLALRLRAACTSTSCGLASSNRAASSLSPGRPFTRGGGQPPRPPARSLLRIRRGLMAAPRICFPRKPPEIARGHPFHCWSDSAMSADWKTLSRAEADASVPQSAPQTEMGGSLRPFPPQTSRHAPCKLPAQERSPWGSGEQGRSRPSRGGHAGYSAHCSAQRDPSPGILRRWDHAQERCPSRG